MTLATSDPSSHVERSFLFLQGPQSRFTRRLGLAVHGCGAQVTKVNFCGGDVLHWPAPFTVLYRGARDAWPRWVSRLMEQHAVTDLVLLGDRRPMHSDAICIAHVRGIQVHILEEGYLRPNYVTLERNGVNAHSSLPNTPEAVRERAAVLSEPPPMRSIPDSSMCRLGGTILHHVGNTLLYGLFPRYHTHRPHPILWELTGILPRYCMRYSRFARSRAAQERLRQADRPYFLFPLQLDADSQVRSYSFYGVRDSIMQVLASFARAASPDMLLAVKNHPLDNGLINLAAFVAGFARATGIEDRVIFLDGGQGTPLMCSPACRGVVVVNSTMGLEALALGQPVFSLGKATYGMPGLAVTTQEGTLNDFWSAPRPPDMHLLHDFLNTLHADALVPGNFYTLPGIEAAVEGCLRRIGLGA